MLVPVHRESGKAKGFADLSAAEKASMLTERLDEVQRLLSQNKPIPKEFAAGILKLAKGTQQEKALAVQFPQLLAAAA